MASKGRGAKKTKKPTAQELLSTLLRKLGARGGSARAKNMTAAARSEGARRAVQARWAKVKAKKRAT